MPDEAPTPAEIETILAVPDIADPLGLRDRAVMELLYSSGIRRGEVVGLGLGDLNRSRATLHLRQTKSRQDRIVPVGSRAMAWVVRYLEEVRPRLELNQDEQSLFLTAYGEGFHPDVLGRLVAKYIQQSSIGRKGGCHLFRHAFATHLLEGGADIRIIQRLLGHQKLETTAIYTEISIESLRSTYEACHPAEKAGKGEDGTAASL